jgi:hypothetical protein
LFAVVCLCGQQTGLIITLSAHPGLPHFMKNAYFVKFSLSSAS